MIATVLIEVHCISLISFTQYLVCSLVKYDNKVVAVVSDRQQSNIIDGLLGKIEIINYCQSLEFEYKKLTDKVLLYK